MEEGKINNSQASDKESTQDEKSYAEEASKFIEETSLEKMHEIAEAARLKKLMEPPKWVFPEDS